MIIGDVGLTLPLDDATTVVGESERLRDDKKLNKT